jgi:basic membrane protein A
MHKKLYAALTLLLFASLALGACGPAATEAPQEPAPAPTEPMAAPTEAMVETEAPMPGAGVSVCQVTDTGGIDDKSFNATAWKGIQDAMATFGVDGQYLESQEAADYEPNIAAFLDQGCDLIVTVGFFLGDATSAAATANPDRAFSIVDMAYDPVIPNVLGQVFQTDEAAFLAGYVAAGVSQTGIIGTYGGFPIPTVTIFMDGMFYGIQYYNEQHGTDVQLLGWDPANPDAGLMSQTFEDPQAGRVLGESLMDEGADIIMPVAGPVGLGTAAAALERGGVYIVGVDADWYLTSPEYGSIILTSVLKNMDVTTMEAIRQVIDGTFAGGTTLGTLVNGGVGIAPFHDLASLVSADLQAELDTVRQGIIDGTIDVSPGM